MEFRAGGPVAVTVGREAAGGRMAVAAAGDPTDVVEEMVVVTVGATTATGVGALMGEPSATTGVGRRRAVATSSRRSGARGSTSR